MGAVVDDDVPESFAKYRELVPGTYVKFSRLKDDPGGYGATSGCMDWDVIVLARTRLLSEAESIAEAVSKLSGIPYAQGRQSRTRVTTTPAGRAPSRTSPWSPTTPTAKAGTRPTFSSLAVS